MNRGEQGLARYPADIEGAKRTMATKTLRIRRRKHIEASINGQYAGDCVELDDQDPGDYCW